MEGLVVTLSLSLSLLNGLAFEVPEDNTFVSSGGEREKLGGRGRERGRWRERERGRGREREREGERATLVVDSVSAG